MHSFLSTKKQHERSLWLTFFYVGPNTTKKRRAAVWVAYLIQLNQVGPMRQGLTLTPQHVQYHSSKPPTSISNSREADGKVTTTLMTRYASASNE